MAILGTNHSFLDGQIGDFPVEFLINSGYSVTVIFIKLFRQLLISWDPIYHLCHTIRTLHGANGRPLKIHSPSTRFIYL